MSGREPAGPAIETILLEERRYPPPPEFAAQANAGPDIYERDLEQFWREEGLARVSWSSPFETVLEWKVPYARWYLGGKLNVCHNCVDRHVEAGNGAKTAFHWEGEPPDDRRTISFAELQREVVRPSFGSPTSEALRDFGLGAQVLADLGCKKIRLMMWSDRKIPGLEGFGIDVVERVPIPPRLRRKEALS